MHGLSAARMRRWLRLVVAASGLAAMAGGATASATDAVAVQWTGTATIAEGGAGWGRLAPLPDGRWLAVVTRFHPGAATTLELSASADAARTWSPLATVAEPGRDIDNGELRVLPDGRILLAMRSLVDGQSYRLDVYRSDDDGSHWDFLSTIDRNEALLGRKDRGLWEPMLSLLPDGSLSVLYADETLADAQPAYSQVVSQRISTDGGATWSAKTSIVAQPGGGSARPGMPVMTRLQDGRYLLVFEICGDDPHCPVSYKLSADGRRWPEGLGAPLPGQNCGPHVLATREGRVFVTSCQNEIGWSDDAGASWRRNSSPAWPFGFRHSWPALYQTAPDEIAVVNGVGQGTVRVRFGRLAASAATAAQRSFRNPLLPSGPDPWIVQHGGAYYYMNTLGNRLAIRKTSDITRLADAPETTIWTPPATGPNAQSIWAPELHRIDGKWYVYYTAAESGHDDDAHRGIFVLENASDDPTQGTWVDKGRLKTGHHGIDGTTFAHGGKRYFVYSPYVGSDSDLAIVAMSNPWTLAGEETIVARPDLAWERQGGRQILEGPEFLSGPKGDLFLTYSGSACWSDDYAIGLLSAPAGSDPLDASSWTKAPRPVLAKDPEQGVYAPGHNGFFASPDGSETWVVYHANPGPGLGCTARRSPRIQRVDWTPDGKPRFDRPAGPERVLAAPAGSE